MCVSLTELPVIEVPRRTVLVNNGDSAMLVCNAHGIPTPNITWYRDGIQASMHFDQILSLIMRYDIEFALTKWHTSYVHSLFVYVWAQDFGLKCQYYQWLFPVATKCTYSLRMVNCALFFLWDFGAITYLLTYFLPVFLPFKTIK